MHNRIGQECYDTIDSYGILSVSIDSNLALKQDDSDRPLRDLLLLMPLLPVSEQGEIDYNAASPALLMLLGANADLSMRTLHRGTAAIGRLLVAVSPEIGTGEFSADAMESVGWLISELSDLAATAQCLSVACHRYTADYAPATPKNISPTRP